MFRVWEIAVSFLGLPPLALVPRENTNRRGTVQRRTIWIADAHRDGKRFPSKEIPAAWSAQLHGRIFEAVTATVRRSRRNASASPSEHQCSSIELDENSLTIPTMVQERGQSTLQPKMRSHTIENRFYAMSLDRPDISIFSQY